jgi:hypothetical protein
MKRTILLVLILAGPARGATIQFADAAGGDYTVIGATDVEVDGELWDYVIEETSAANIPVHDDLSIGSRVASKMTVAIAAMQLPWTTTGNMSGLRRRERQ